MTKVVVDVNVVISAAINPSGTPADLLRRLAGNSDYRFVASLEIVKELRAAFTYPGVKKALKLSEHEVAALVVGIENLAETVDPETLKTGWSRDVKDDIYIQAAIAAKARFLVSGDKDLLVLGIVEGVQILSPRQMLDVLLDQN